MHTAGPTWCAGCIVQPACTLATTKDGEFAHTANVPEAHHDQDFGEDKKVAKVHIWNRWPDDRARIVGTVLTLRNSSNQIVGGGAINQTQEFYAFHL